MKFAYLIEPPFNHVEPDGTVAGCDVDLARYVCSELGIETFEPVETEFAELLPGLAAGRWRMTTGLFDTAERRAFACFSRPIWALPDGLLVRKQNPSDLNGYATVAKDPGCVLAVVRDQLQHRSAVAFDVPEDRIRIFETYAQAAQAVRDGEADAYASVALAHNGFILRHPDWQVASVTVPTSEKRPAFGAFAFALGDEDFRDSVDQVLGRYLGSTEHRRMVARHGFTDAEMDLLTGG